MFWSLVLVSLSDVSLKYLHRRNGKKEAKKKAKKTPLFDDERKEARGDVDEIGS